MYTQGTIQNIVDISTTTESITGPVDDDTVGLYTVTYTATDESGNSAAIVETVTVQDTTPPNTPTIIQPSLLTNSDSITISGTAEAGSTITLTQNNVQLTPTTVGSDETWSVDVTLANGNNSFTVTATDDANNKSQASAPIVVTLDDTPPPVPAITTVPATVSSSPITISGGSTESGATITLYNGETSVGTTTADDSGNFSFTQVALANGNNSFTVTATDDANNKSQASAPIVVTLDDTMAPVKPTLTYPLVVNPNTFSNPTLNENPITFTGTAQAGSTLTLQSHTNNFYTTTVGDDGTWSIPDVPVTNEGQNAFFASATDDIGNKSDYLIIVF